MTGKGKDQDLGSLGTEAVRSELAELDVLDVIGLVALMTSESTRATDAVVAATSQIADAVEAIAGRLADGGRLIYVGAGTPGRLGVLDAAETGPTFDVPEGLVLAVVAGGRDAFVRPAEGAEDDDKAAAIELRALGCSPLDCVVGISASGRTPFVVGAVNYARTVGAMTIGVVCNRGSAIADAAALAIELVVGGEVIAGSTRLNAGTAQKITLNILSTAAMVLLGKTYGNLMVDVRPTNDKLRGRATRIVAMVAHTSPARARAALEECGWRTKVACLVATSTMSVEEATALLAASAGHLRAALETAGGTKREETNQTRRHTGGPRRLGVAAFLQHGRLVRGDLACEDGAVVALGLSPGGHGIAVPGLVDLQVNGYAGIETLGASVGELSALGRALARDGVLAYQPTLISSDAGRTKAAAARIAALSRLEPDGARILGIHLEGPFLSPLHAGAHPSGRLAEADVELLRPLLDAGPVTMVTLAPELDGALELVTECVRRSIAVSFGHSGADSEQARRGFEAGGRAVTHIFNAMTTISARAPGLAGVALADPRVTIQVIADGVHVADDLLLLVVSAAHGRWNLVSDATAASSLGDGEHLLGEVRVFAEHGVVRRQDGTIAGSAAGLLDGVRHLASLGAPLGEVIAAATERPAALVNNREVGRIRLGARADIVVLDDELAIHEVLLGGRSVF